MKKIFTKFFLFAALLAASTNLSAQTYNGGTWYSLYDASERTLKTSTWFENKEIYNYTSVLAPSTGVLTFDTKMTKHLGVTNPKSYEISVNGTRVSVPAKQTNYLNRSVNVSTDATSISFVYIFTDYNSERTLSIANVKLPLAQHILLANNTTKDSKSFGNVAIDGASAGQTISLRSFLTNGDITVKSSDNAFRINSTSNLSGATYAVGANACASANGADGAQAGGATLGDIDQYAFSIYFCPTEAKEYSATITITDGTSTATVTVSGVGVKKTQQLTWAADFQADEVSLPVGEEIVNPATTNSGLTLTYTSSNDSVLAVEGTTIKALKAGKVTLTVEHAGDDKWNPIYATKTITVTEKTIQFIHWIDNLTRLVVGGEPVQLTATAQILLNAETDEIQDAPERTALITYQSADDNVVTIDGTTLVVVGEGTTTVTASLPGDDTYEATTISMPVRVRVPSTTCEAYVLDAPEEHNYSSEVWGEYETAELSGPANQLTFEAKKQYVWGVGGVSNVQIQQLVNGDWNTIDKINPGKDYQLYGPYDLDRNATKVRFCTENGSYRRYFKNVLVSQATYLETTTSAITIEKSIVGDQITKTIAVQYSNLPEGVTVTNTSDIITLSYSELGVTCGTYGEKIITLTISPVAVGTVEDVVTIHDEATGLTLNIPVTIHTQRNTQTIQWEDSIETIYATDDITLTATAQTSIHYTSSDSAIAYVDAANNLIINTVGGVTITAHAAETEVYEAAELSKHITILPTVPVVLAMPTVEPVAYGVELTNDLLVGGEANVGGTFVWNTDLKQELVPGEYNLPIQFIPTDPIFAIVDTTIAVTVTKAHQSIVWEQDFSEVYVVDTLYLEAKALTELYYEITDWNTGSIDENQLVFFKAGTLRVDAIAKEDDFYYGDTLSVVITINPEENTSFVTKYPTATSIVYGQMLGESMLEGGAATVDGEFKWNDGDILLSVGTHYMLAIFAPAQAELYADIKFMVEVEVTKAPQTIDWSGDVPAMLELGDTVTLTATASSGLEVVYELDVEGVVEIDGEYMIAIGEGTVNVTATQDGLDEFGKANYLPADPVTYTITVIKSDVNTGLEAVEPNANTARKIIRDGLLYVIRGEHTYNALGELIR